MDNMNGWRFHKFFVRVLNITNFLENQFSAGLIIWKIGQSGGYATNYTQQHKTTIMVNIESRDV